MDKNKHVLLHGLTILKKSKNNGLKIRKFIMNNNPNDLLHGLTLKTIVNKLVEFYGWDELGQKININCFIVYFTVYFTV